MTLLPVLVVIRTAISTHTLTWSVTDIGPHRRANRWHFNSHAHVERDVQVEGEVEDSSISTHTLTWSVTNVWYKFR